MQNAEDCIARGMDPDDFLPRFTFFFDISMSFFEEVAKFRAGRRIWARLARERLGARDPRSWRFKFHGQTSGVDLTRQQPLNNIARVTAQAMAGIFGGLQSLHTDAYDEVYSTPSEAGARIAVATQNILREEAHLTDVIDPLGGSFYVESLTDAMEEKIARRHEARRRRRRHVQGGRVGPGAAHDRPVGDALPAADRVAASRSSSASTPTAPTTTRARRPAVERPDAAAMRAPCATTSSPGRPGARRRRSTPRSTASAAPPATTRGNVFGAVVDGARAGLTQRGDLRPRCAASSASASRWRSSDP